MLPESGDVQLMIYQITSKETPTSNQTTKEEPSGVLHRKDTLLNFILMTLPEKPTKNNQSNSSETKRPD